MSSPEEPPGPEALEYHPALRAYVARIRARPTVATALAYEVPLFQAESAANAATVAAGGGAAAIAPGPSPAAATAPR